ncbi:MULTISPECIES: discoidin domain-containing protein [Pelosinus]|nr:MULTISPECIES: discoidin domain-containing protein [Pelosinus]
MLAERGGQLGRNVVLNGPYSTEGAINALIKDTVTAGQVIVQESTLIAFAAGFNAKGARDYIQQILADITLGLTVANSQTIPLSYTADLCTGGTPISGGDYSTNVKANAFDNDNASAWGSSQIAAATNGAAYIGYIFTIATAIRKLRLYQPSATGAATSVKAQYSDDGTAWTTANIITVAIGENSITLPPSGSHKYWRLLCNNAQGAGCYWYVQEIEMYEALQTHYVYVTRDANGNLTVGSTKNKPRTVKPEVASVVPGHYTADVCEGGTAISGGDSGIYVAGRAFNNDGSATAWASYQSAANQLGAAYIGYNFGTPKSIRRVEILQSSIANNAVSSLKVEYSADGLTWNTAVTQGVGVSQNTIYVPAVGSYQYWRLLANNNLPSGSTWGVPEVEMAEYVELTVIEGQVDETIYTDNLCVGGAAIASGETAGYPKEYAFNSNQADNWGSEGGTSYTARQIGYDFGVARHIRLLTINTTTFANNAKIQRSTDGNAWNDVKTTALTPGINKIVLDASTPSRYWRVLGNSTTRIDGVTATSNTFQVAEITMHEISSDVNLYDPVKGIATHYDGSTWDTVTRVFIGEAVTDSAGNVVSCTPYPYNKTKVKALPGEDSDDVVTLGQFTALLTVDGWMLLPVNFNGKKVDFVVQWGRVPAGTTVTDATLPIKFPEACLLAVPVDLTNTTAVIPLGWSADSSTLTTVRFYSNTNAAQFAYIAIGY